MQVLDLVISKLTREFLTRFISQGEIFKLNSFWDMGQSPNKRF